MRKALHFPFGAVRLLRVRSRWRHLRRVGWDKEAEAGRERDAGGIGISERDQDSGTGFGREKLGGGGIERGEEFAGDVEWCGEEDGVEGLGCFVFAGGGGEDGPGREFGFV
jgi:hypothetical protein